MASKELKTKMWYSYNICNHILYTMCNMFLWQEKNCVAAGFPYFLQHQCHLAIMSCHHSKQSPFIIYTCEDSLEELVKHKSVWQPSKQFTTLHSTLSKFKIAFMCFLKKTAPIMDSLMCYLICVIAPENMVLKSDNIICWQERHRTVKNKLSREGVFKIQLRTQQGN